MNYCRVCHRQLTNRESIARGIGPICSMDYGRQMDMFGHKPDFEHALRDAGSTKVLCIWDLNSGGMSVTNGAEIVLADLVRAYDVLPAWIIYRDSDGNWDRILATPDGNFQGFSVIEHAHRPKTLDHALQLILDIEG